MPRSRRGRRAYTLHTIILSIEHWETTHGPTSNGLLKLPRQRGIPRRRVFIQECEREPEAWSILDYAMCFTARSEGERDDELLDELCYSPGWQGAYMRA